MWNTGFALFCCIFLTLVNYFCCCRRFNLYPKRCVSVFIFCCADSSRILVAQLEFVIITEGYFHANSLNATVHERIALSLSWQLGIEIKIVIIFAMRWNVRRHENRAPWLTCIWLSTISICRVVCSHAFVFSDSVVFFASFLPILFVFILYNALNGMWISITIYILNLPLMDARTMWVVLVCGSVRGDATQPLATTQSIFHCCSVSGKSVGESGSKMLMVIWNLIYIWVVPLFPPRGSESATTKKERSHLIAASERLKGKNLCCDWWRSLATERSWT